MLPTSYQTYIHQSRYARWSDSLGRRETWEETVERYIDFFRKREGTPSLRDPIWGVVKQAILNLEVMPSMRCLMTAGKALDRDNVAGYNCAYLAINRPRAFDEAMYIKELEY